MENVIIILLVFIVWLLISVILFDHQEKREKRREKPEPEEEKTVEAKVYPGENLTREQQLMNLWLYDGSNQRSKDFREDEEE